jgi:hypothetical protein
MDSERQLLQGEKDESGPPQINSVITTPYDEKLRSAHMVRSHGAVDPAEDFRHESSLDVVDELQASHLLVV